MFSLRLNVLFDFMFYFYFCTKTSDIILTLIKRYFSKHHEVVADYSMQNVILQIDPLLKIKMLDYYILCQTCWRKCGLGVQLHDIVIASNKRNVFRFRDFCRHLHKFQAINRSWLCTIWCSIQYSEKYDIY